MGVRIDGKKIADELLASLREQIKVHNLHPHLEVILVGADPGSLSYIKQKQKAAESIGATVNLTQFSPSVTKDEMIKQIQSLNSSSTVSGIIIQRPLPAETKIPASVISSIIPQKDVDGFVPHSRYEVPVAKAIIKILEYIFYKEFDTPQIDLINWLRTQRVVIIGKGETAGKPILHLFERLSIPVIVIDRSTLHPHELMKNATILISCAGSAGLITGKHIRDSSILIAVGLSRSEGSLVGDYDEENIREKVSFYTPTPGGVGPVNVACLMENLVKASER